MNGLDVLWLAGIGFDLETQAGYQIIHAPG
jgi:hypothetical protein